MEGVWWLPIPSWDVEGLWVPLVGRNSGGACSPGPAYQPHLSGVQGGPRVLSWMEETVWRLIHIMSLSVSAAAVEAVAYGRKSTGS